MTMKATHTIEIIDDMAITRFFTKPGLSEILSVMNEVSAKGAFRRRLWVLENGINLRTDEITAIANHGKQIWPMPSKAAIVACDDLSFGLLRVHDVYREQEGHETGVFRTEHEALAWLNDE